MPKENDKKTRGQVLVGMYYNQDLSNIVFHKLFPYPSLNLPKGHDTPVTLAQIHHYCSAHLGLAGLMMKVTQAFCPLAH